MSHISYPNNKLTAIIRNDGPLIHCGDTPSYRSVHIELTPEQVQLMEMYYYEEISRVFIETIPVKPDPNTAVPF